MVGLSRSGNGTVVRTRSGAAVAVRGAMNRVVAAHLMQGRASPAHQNNGTTGRRAIATRPGNEAGDGSPGAAGGFGAFYERTYPAALRVAFGIVGERATADDVTQDAYATA